jgi:hypothetical protein
MVRLKYIKRDRLRNINDVFIFPNKRIIIHTLISLKINIIKLIDYSF